LLSRVFQPEDPALRVSLPTEKRLQLETKLNSLPREVFLADDSLGWVYQFWQRDEKNRVNKSEVKIGADELAPVTQLFTEDYMVLFLLENTLGAWWTARHGKPALPGYTWTYLRLNEDGTPAAGTFDGWPKSAKELRVLDPCMGSGHFLTFALPILARMRATEEGVTLADAILAVLRDNLFGLELDPRCSQIAAFNLALTAWKLNGRHFEIPQLNLACSGLGINAKEEDWVKLAGTDGRKQDLMRWLYSLFHNAPILGSLIDPRRVGKPMVEDEIAGLLPLLERALATEQSTDDIRELAIAAQGLLAAARILSDTFTLVVTNVPYLGRGRQDESLKTCCETFHGDAKADLATCFVDRCLRFCEEGGSVALVTPQNWLFLTRYKGLRGRLLKAMQWNLVARLGPHAFETITGEVVNVALLGITRRSPSLGHGFAGWDVGEEKTTEEKAQKLMASFIISNQSQQLENPDFRITLGTETQLSLLSEYASTGTGMQTFDSPRFLGRFWEFNIRDSHWVTGQSTVEATREYGGTYLAVRWENGSGQLYELVKAMEAVGYKSGIWKAGSQFWGQKGVLVSLMRGLACTLYMGLPFDNNAGVLIPRNPDNLPAIWAFCSSQEFSTAVRRVDQKLNVTNATLGKIPFDLSTWRAASQSGYPHGLPKPFSSDPTQSIFAGHPRGSDEPLQAAVARLVGYRWPRQNGSSFPDCPELDPDGLEAFADTDGIVCLAPFAGEDSAAERLRSLLKAAYGDEYNIAELLKGKKSTTLEDWLRDEFFEEHCRIFHQRPFVWHIWDGRKDGFHVLVNYHALDHKTLEKLIYSSLGDWLTRQRQDLASGVEGADGRLVSAEHLQSELKKILDGDTPFDVFIRWKPIKEQPLAWNPDSNDGVHTNIRPWITAARVHRANKPGILRVTPNIKYGKDRGKEPDRDAKEFPWFKDTRDRHNDIHLSLNQKRRGRGLA